MAGGMREMDVVRNIEASDPANVRFHQLPMDKLRLVVKHRFGGTAGGDPVKVTAGLVCAIRRERARSGHDAFKGEKEIWDARNAMALDEDDGLALDQYIGTVVGMQFFRMLVIREIGGKAIGRTMDTACLRLRLTTVKRWPRLRPHWRRFQRRLCHNCPACAHLGEPRYMVCSGCGVARYCSEECQRLHWPRHREECHAIQAAALEVRKNKENLRQFRARRETLERQADAPR